MGRSVCATKSSCTFFGTCSSALDHDCCQRTTARKTPATSHGMGSWRGIDQEFCDPCRHLQECPGARACAFWAILGPCLGEPQREWFLTFLGPKNAKKHSKALFWLLRGRCPKSLKKHSVAHFQAWARGHSCKWRQGSQQELTNF